MYPGFVDANTQLGLIEVGTANGSNDTQEVGNVNPNRAKLVNPDSDLLPVAPSTASRARSSFPAAAPFTGCPRSCTSTAGRGGDMTVQRGWRCT